MNDQIKYWYRKYLPESFRNFARKLIPTWLELRFFSFTTKNFNYEIQGHGEAKKILELCEELQIKSGHYVDIGAADGWTSSSTYPFAKDDSFSGLSIELDDRQYKKMEFIYKNFKNAHLLKKKVTPDNIVKLLNEHSTPKEFEILNLDIDSYDLFVLKEILKYFEPKIISMEINEKIPPPVIFTVLYDKQHFWQNDHFFGCSIQAAYEEVSKFKYKLFTLVYNNAIFIRDDLNIDFKEPSVLEAYNEGYKNKHDRVEKFSYNRDVDCVLDMDNKDIILFFNNFYKQYKGLYELKL